MERGGEKKIVKDSHNLLLPALVLALALAFFGTPVEARMVKYLQRGGKVSPATTHLLLGYKRSSFEVLSRGLVPPSKPNYPPGFGMLPRGPVPPSEPKYPPGFGMLPKGSIPPSGPATPPPFYTNYWNSHM